MITRCRFAPSPTGRLHVGGARTALFNLLFARRTAGRFVLRIEDTDQVRSSAQSEAGILADLRWLSLSWDEGPDLGGAYGPYRQSERLHRYDEVIAQMLAAGTAYEAWESPEELDALRAQIEGGALRYRKRSYSPEQLAAYAAEGRKPVVRLRVPALDIQFRDLVLGEVRVAAEDMDDFVLRKADGFPTYHFAVVVDDHDMAITHVLRAQEHLMNTPKHLALYTALGWTPPEHGHMPLIFSMGGGKMSKRDKAKAAREQVATLGLDAAAVAARAGLELEPVTAFLERRTDEVGLAVAIGEALGADLPEIDVVDFRQAGYLPEALINYLALLGWSAGDDRERYTLDELFEAFSLDRVGSTAARFDRVKLRAMNGHAIRESSPERLLQALRDYAELNRTPLGSAPEPWLKALIHLYRERIQTLRELDSASRFFFERPSSWSLDKAVKKALLKGEPTGLVALGEARALFERAPVWEEHALEALFQAHADQHHQGKIGKLAQPVRIAVTGGPVSPPLFGTVALLPREEVLARIDACVAFFADVKD